MQYVLNRRFWASVSMSISKFAASVLSGTQETTVALAALNFDFALFKTEAPKEYKALGSALTPYRREVAEDGDIHATARKLRAMFEQILPPTPSLYTAYGMRASEIASRYAFTGHSISPLNPTAHRGLSLFDEHDLAARRPRDKGDTDPK